MEYLLKMLFFANIALNLKLNLCTLHTVTVNIFLE